jgi:biotin transporter BioY
VAAKTAIWKESLAADILSNTVFIMGSYVFGAGWYMLSSGATPAATVVTSVPPFIAGDCVKSVTTEAIVLRFRQAGTELISPLL